MIQTIQRLGGVARMAQGSSFGHYELRELLGRGGMGEVYRAFDPRMNRMVALKLLPPHLAGDPSFEQRFRREATAAAALTDPHVIPIHSSGEIDGRLYVDMRLVEGPELQQLLNDGRLDAERAVRIVEQIAGALDAAHHVGLIHRDVKPSNIMVGPDDFAYLIDFGIAQAAGEDRLTQAGDAVGTLDYMAPERFDGASATPASDIYALTCVLFQCLTGAPPYASSSTEQIIAGHMVRTPPRPSDRGVARAFDPVVARGLAKRPRDRFGSARQLGSAARTALTTPEREGPTLETELPTREERMRGPVPRAPKPVAPPRRPSAAVPPRRPVVVTPPPSTPPVSAPPTVPANSSKRRWVLLAVAVVTVVAVVAVFLIPWGGRTPDAPPPPPEPSEQRALLDAAELDRLLGVKGFEIVGRSDKLRDSLPNTNENDPCVAVVSIGEFVAYDGSGWVAIRTQMAESEPPDVRHVRQSATRFDSNTQAKELLSTARETWKACVGRDIVLYEQGTEGRWRAESLDAVSGVVIAQKVVLTDDGTTTTPDWICPHAMGIAGTVVVEVSICSANTPDGVDRAIRLVDAMVKRASAD